MAVAPVDFLAVAKALSASHDECSLRSATSRAYYAAYHACSKWHASLPAAGANIGPGGGMHQVLINQLKNPDNSLSSERKKLSRFTSVKLSVMRQRRTQADYFLDSSPGPSDTADQVAQVEGLLLQLV